jgi:hypothetical protein
VIVDLAGPAIDVSSAGPAPDAPLPIEGDAATADTAGASGDAVPAMPGVTVISGAVQKGPFRAGSEVKVTMLDGQGNPLGAPIVGFTKNDLGEFSFEVPARGPVEIVATGLFFRQPSFHLKPISVRALVDLRGGSQRVFVNTMTHVIAGRALKLFRGGATFTDALAEAQNELQRTLGQFVPGPIRPADSIDLFGEDDDSSAYLSVLEATIASDPDTTRWLDMTTEGFGFDGVVDGESTHLFPLILADIDVPLRAETLRAFARSQGREPVIPDLERALDFDRDGIADRSDPDADGDGIPAAAEKFIAAANDGPNLALRSDGTVWTFSGRRVLPLAGIKAVVAASASEGPSWVVALQSDGTVWQQSEQAGGTTSAMTRVPGLTDVKAIVAAEASLEAGFRPAQILVLKNDGTVWLVTDQGAAPVQFVALTGAVALGHSNTPHGAHILAAMADGSVFYAVPSEPRGAFAIPGVVARAVFAAPEGRPAIASDCALASDNTVWCWAYEGANGRMPRPPFQVLKLAGTAVVNSSRWVTVVKTDGTVWRWQPGEEPAPIIGCVGAVSANDGFPALVATITGSIVRCDYRWDPRMIGVPDTGFVLPYRLPR